MTLSGEKLKKIEKEELERLEEEKYRNTIRKQLIKRPWYSYKRLWIFVLFLFIGIISDSSSNNANNSSLDDPNATPTPDNSKELVGEVTYVSGAFQITVIGEDWKVCDFTLNKKYNYPGRTSNWISGSKIRIFESGETFVIGSGEFVLLDGTRFNSYQTKPTTLTVSCENGLGVWSW